MPERRVTRSLGRALWVVAGLAAVGIGSVGVVVPGLPTTPFFIVAAWCFSRSSPRLEQWVLELRGIGPLVRDHRAGLGVPRRVKATALTMVVVAVSLSAWVVASWPVRVVIVVAGLIGFAYVAFAVPTRGSEVRRCGTGA